VRGGSRRRPEELGLILAAPNGEAVLCVTSLGDGGSPDNVTLVTIGATPSTFALPAGGLGLPYVFLPDSTLTWSIGGTLFAKPVSGGPVATVATSIASDTSIGGSQVVTFGNTSVVSAFVVDAAGKSPGFELSPSPDTTAVFAPTSGGVVAYASAGSIYAVKTN
jgi:hypothetical protein